MASLAWPAAIWRPPPPSSARRVFRRPALRSEQRRCDLAAAWGDGPRSVGSVGRQAAQPGSPAQPTPRHAHHTQPLHVWLAGCPLSAKDSHHLHRPPRRVCEIVGTTSTWRHAQRRHPCASHACRGLGSKKKEKGDRKKEKEGNPKKKKRYTHPHTEQGRRRSALACATHGKVCAPACRGKGQRLHTHARLLKWLGWRAGALASVGRSGGKQGDAARGCGGGPGGEGGASGREARASRRKVVEYDALRAGLDGPAGRPASQQYKLFLRVVKVQSRVQNR